MQKVINQNNIGLLDSDAAILTGVFQNNVGFFAHRDRDQIGYIGPGLVGLETKSFANSVCLVEVTLHQEHSEADVFLKIGVFVLDIARPTVSKHPSPSLPLSLSLSEYSDFFQ